MASPSRATVRNPKARDGRGQTQDQSAASPGPQATARSLHSLALAARGNRAIACRPSQIAERNSPVLHVPGIPFSFQRNISFLGLRFCERLLLCPGCGAIASKCQDRALLLLQIAQDCPGFREQATHLAREWLFIAAFADRLSRQNGQAEGTRGANLGTSRLWMN